MVWCSLRSGEGVQGAAAGGCAGRRCGGASGWCRCSTPRVGVGVGRLGAHVGVGSALRRRSSVSASAAVGGLRRAPSCPAKHHRHVATFEPGLGLDLDVRADHVEDLIEDLRAELRVGHLAPSELQRHLDLVTFVDELVDLADLDVEVAPADLRPELDFLDRHVRRLAPGLLGLLGLLVPELAVVHDPAHRRVGHRGHLDEVEVESPGHLQRLGYGFDAQLIAVRTDEADLAGSDAIVDAVLLAVSRCGAAMAAHSCAMGGVSLFDGGVGCSTRSPRSDRRPTVPGTRGRAPAAVGPGRTRHAGAGGGQVGVAPTSPQIAPGRVAHVS